MKKAIFTSSAATGRSPWIPTFWGLLKAWNFKESFFGGTLGGRSRSEAVAEGLRGALARPESTEGALNVL